MESQSNIIRDFLLKRIRAGILIPGDPIDETTLSEKFKVSGTPVREALTQLQALGLIERAPRAGARIFQPDIERLIGMIELHAELEGTTAHFAARRIGPDQEEKLLEAVEACESFVADPSNVPQKGYYQLNIDFHIRMIEATNNDDLMNAMISSSDRLISYFRARHRLRGEPIRSARDHRAIAKAILAGDAEKARELTIRHVTVDGATILDVVKKMNERF